MSTKNELASVGFSRIFFGILDAKETVTDVVVVSDKSGGAIEFKTSGFAGTSNIQWASNIAYYVSQAGVGSGKVEVTTATYPSDVMTKILGDVMEDGIYLTKGNVKQPYVAVIAETNDELDNPAYVGVAKCRFTTADGDDLKTGEDKGKTPENASLSGSAVTRKSDSLVKGKCTTSDDGVTLATFAKKMFPGYTGDLEEVYKNSTVTAPTNNETDGDAA